MVIITQLNHVRPLQLDFERTWAIISVVVLVEVQSHIPASSNPLLFAGDISGDFGVQLRCHVPHPVVSRHTRGANVALETVFASTVQGHSANRSILGTVFAESSRRAHIQTKAVSQHCQEVLLRHSFGHDIFPEDGGFQEPSGARTSSRAKVNLVVRA